MMKNVLTQLIMLLISISLSACVMDPSENRDINSMPPAAKNPKSNNSIISQNDSNTNVGDNLTARKFTG